MAKSLQDVLHIHLSQSLLLSVGQGNRMAQWHVQQQIGRMERLVAGKHIPLCYFPLNDNGASGTPYIAVTHQSCTLHVLQPRSPPGKGTGSLQGFLCRNTLLPPMRLSSSLPAPEAAFNGRLCLAELIVTDKALPCPLALSCRAQHSIPAPLPPNSSGALCTPPSSWQICSLIPCWVQPADTYRYRAWVARQPYN